MREIRTSGSMRGGRKRAFAWRACLLLYGVPKVYASSPTASECFLRHTGLLHGSLCFSHFQCSDHCKIQRRCVRTLVSQSENTPSNSRVG